MKTSANAFIRLFIDAKDKKDHNRFKQVFNMIIVVAIVAALLGLAVDNLGYQFKWSTLWEYKRKILLGYEMTLVISFFSLFLALFLGLVFSFAQKSKILIFRYISHLYVEIIRGTPFLVQIYVFYFIVATAIGLENKYLVGIIILSLFSGAYVTEIIRAGMDSIPQTQHETARAVGFTDVQKYRYIIIPQVIRRIMPALAGQLVSLVKDSSLLSVIAVSELTMNMLEIESLNFRTFENYLCLALGYMIITIPISQLSKYLEKTFYYES
jgi:amine acid ABC transporter, permease protein, 3-TM region, His/Glu/Gln/Arg/opine family